MAAVLFQGTIISIGKLVDTLTPIGCLVGYDRTGGDKTEIDSSCSESVAKEFVFGMIDSGSLTCDVNYDPSDSGWAIAEESEASTELYFFSIEFSDKPDETGTGTIKTFEGSVTSTSDSGALDDKLSGTINIRISGAITTVPPTPTPIALLTAHRKSIADKKIAVAKAAKKAALAKNPLMIKKASSEN